MNSRLFASRFLQKALATAALVLLPAAFAPSASMATTVSMGTSHDCSVADTGVATCWGSLPMQDQAPSMVYDVKVGRDFSCALLGGGIVRCWGNNDFSQLGANATTVAGQGVGGLMSFAQLAVGATHACALLNAQAYCWGDGRQGQLGGGSATSAATPGAVVGLSSAKHLAAGRGVTCVVQHDGRVACVGLGSELSGGLDEPRVARTVPGITDALEVALFDGHACVLRVQGKVSCWGQNRYGELGIPASSDILRSPVEVTGLGAAAKAVAVGNGYTCALLVNGTIRCWGNNANGQLGTALGGAATGLVTGITDATAISAGQTAACAALQGGYVQCWGQGAGWSSGICGILGGLYPEHPASYGPIVDITLCRPQGSFAPMAVKGLGPANDAAQVLDWAEKTLPQTFPPQGAPVPAPIDALYLREYPGGHKLAVNGQGTPHLLYLGPLTAGQLADLGPLGRWLNEATQDEGVKSGMQLQAAPYLNLMPGVVFPGTMSQPCNDFLVPFGIRGGVSGLPEGVTATAVRVENGGAPMEFPIRDQYRNLVLTTQEEWISVRIRRAGEPIPPGMKEEPVLRGTAQGCPVAVRSGDTVDVAVFYSQGNRKGQLRTRAKVGAAY